MRFFCKEQRGSIVLEASLVLPFFLAFVVGMVICIQIALLELALQTGVAEATKTFAGQLYPLRLLMLEAKTKYDQSSSGEMLNSAIERVKSARSQVMNTEDLAEEYAAYIPDSLMELVRWEKEKREFGESKAGAELSDLYENQILERMYAAFTPIVYAFCDRRTIRKDSFKVSSMTLPSMESGGDAFIGIEAQITYKLPLPFMSHTITLRKKAYERAWVGV
ncbi:hypothetical protein GCM10008018_37770 [Paenibacillus marchantiophytorum]|uniref:Pilus assembly protein n=1 Tax=Paenibacillus marchantiophytorum TaxID=1619310 RepID=A0ABQ1EUN2_9BACL|nr:hypothetical protein GCM10008018_37770 [Paenibacillus marchantiophytorum]